MFNPLYKQHYRTESQKPLHISVCTTKTTQRHKMYSTQLHIHEQGYTVHLHAKWLVALE